jgi:RimJ/RimL family protein N-acetyltransferase
MPLVLSARRRTGRLDVADRVSPHAASIAVDSEGKHDDNKQMLNLRPATPGDEHRVLNWRNEASTRNASFSTEEISADEHHLWFVRKLEEPGCVLLIVEEAGRPIGQVRLDRVGPDLGELSIGLAPEVRGRGLGREALRQAVLEAPRLLDVTNIRAVVKHGNDASLAAFRAAGFRIIGDDGESVELLRTLDADPSPD